MSVGFGLSVGDFLTALELVGTVIDALRDTGNAKAAFKSLLDELRALQSALLRVEQLDLDHALSAQKLALIQAASQCQQTIHNFWSKVQKYQPHLTNCGSSSRVIDGWYKIKWAVCRKGDLEVFRAELQGHTSSVELLLITVLMEASTMNGRQQQVDQRAINSRVQSLHSAVMAKLNDLAASGAAGAQQHNDALVKLTANVIDANCVSFECFKISILQFWHCRAKSCFSSLSSSQTCSIGGCPCIWK